MYTLFAAVVTLLWSWRMWDNACDDFAHHHEMSGFIQLIGALVLMFLGACLGVLFVVQNPWSP
jgi:hypothetical protein